MFRIARAIVLALALAALAGCSTIRIGYPHLDTYASWTVDEYFDLDSQQKDEFRKRFARLHAWHRYEQLPDYAEFLAKTKARLERGFTREDALLIRVTALGWEIPYVESLDELRRAYVLCPECRERKHDHSREEKEARS